MPTTAVHIFMSSTYGKFCCHYVIFFSSSIGTNLTPTSFFVCQTFSQLRRGPAVEERIITKLSGNSISLISFSLAPPAETFCIAPKQMNLLSPVTKAVRTPALCLALALCLIGSISCIDQIFGPAFDEIRIPSPSRDSSQVARPLFLDEHRKNLYNACALQNPHVAKVQFVDQNMDLVGRFKATFTERAFGGSPK